MTTTLSNGVKVPDVGSTNWASDLETNWTLLNACIGDIGSNVQLNRANTWTATQTFNEPIQGDLAGTATMAGSDADGNDIPTTYATKTELATKQDALTASQLAAVNSGITSALVTQIGTNQTDIAGKVSKAGDTMTGALTPATNGGAPLGSSSLSWSSVYALTYYYNGTAWGLDQRNEWTGDNIVAKDTSPSVWLKITNLTRGTPPSATVTADFGVRAANENLVSQLATQVTSSGNTYVYSRANDGTRDQRVGIFLDATNDTTTYRTASNGVVHLGDSSHKWKSLNGVNPGALGMPDTASRVDISSSITDLTGSTSVTLTQTVNGWLSIGIPAVSGDFVKIWHGDTTSVRYLYQVGYTEGVDYITLLVPIVANVYTPCRIKATGGAVSWARFYPCLGNV